MDLASQTTVNIAICALVGSASLYILPGEAVVKQWCWWHAFAVITAILALLNRSYYYSKFAKLSVVFCKPGTALDAILKENVPTLAKPYKPPLWCAQSHLQTLACYFVGSWKKLKWEREQIRGHDGGKFCIDWYLNDASKQFPNAETRPTVLILPGLMSTSSSAYIRSMASRLADRGFRVSAVIYRGLEGMELLTPLTYCATYTGDLEQAVQIIHARFPKSDLYSIGTSLGSLILGRYLSDKAHNAGMKAGMLFCCPYNAPKCMAEVEKPEHRFLMNMTLARGLKRNYRRHSSAFDSIVNHESIENLKVLREYDEHFTAPVFGYKNLDDYYEDATLTAKRFRNVKVPLLCVSANDDPYSPESALPKEEIATSDNVALVMTHGGGHVSHIQQWFPFSRTYFEEIMEEFFGAFVRIHSETQDG